MAAVDFGIIGKSKNYWFSGFEEAIKKRNYSYKIIEIDRDDWLEQVADIPHIITRFPLKYFDEGREKLFILENILKKNVYPNQETFWHYDNKNAQAFLSRINNFSFPKSFVSYSYEDARKFLHNTNYPIVSKSSQGAGSRNVRLLNNYKQAKKELDYIFIKGKFNRFQEKILRKIGITSNKYSMQRNYVSYQEFIPDNKGDYKLFTIGDRYAYFLYRQNKKNDFRASGSGMIDYDPSKHDLNAILYYLNINKEHNFDTMGYDLLYKQNGEFVTAEISYTVNAKAMYDAPGYYELKDGQLNFIQNKTWPQELILKYLEEKWLTNKMEGHVNNRKS